MGKINTNSVKLYNDIRSLIINYDLPAINISLILEKISTEMERAVDSELQREAKEPDMSDFQIGEDFSQTAEPIEPESIENIEE